MADLGNLQISGPFYQREKLIVSLNVNGIKDEAWFNTTTKSLSGTLKLNGAEAARQVRCHHRLSGMPVQTVTSSASGLFTIGLVSADEYYVVALPTDEDGANAVIVDRVQGV